MFTPAYSLTATERVLPRLALDFTTATLDPRVTVSRALNTATRVNSSGFIETINANLPRFDYDPTTLACLGLLIEETRTNALIFSSDVSSINWNKQASGTALVPVITPDAAISPDGTMNADRAVLSLNGGTTSSDISTLSQSVTFPAGSATYSVWLKSNTGINQTVVLLTFLGNLSIITVTPQWQRFSITVTSTAVSSTIGIRARGTQSQGVIDVLIWGAQLETGAFATSYIPTTTTSLTRNADVASMTGTNFSDWYSATTGAFVAWFDTVRPAGVGYIYSANAGGSFGNSIYQSAYANTTDNYVISGGTQQARLLSGTITANTQAKTGLRYANADFATAANGGALQTQLSGSLPVGVDRLNIGQSAGGGNFLNGHAAKLFWYASLTNAELVAFTK